MHQISLFTPDARRTPTLSLLLVTAMGTLLVVDLAGGLWAATSGINSWGEAWGGRALLAAPLPMIGGQALMTWWSVRGRDRRAVAAAVLLAAACLVSLASGFFDGGLGHADLEPGMTAYQVFLLLVTGVVGLLATARAVQTAVPPARSTATIGGHDPVWFTGGGDTTSRARSSERPLRNP
ncbi:hypothetical protein [Nocardioides euryhalodurans]|uniref:DUF2637 domain-containing protein n=1 Tax=Nocardioides euryhalodurans TaxID=2518370 RepID=A0A4P7GH41_9ACTN|nr:hypothetical protein [Nocardioides euryhalodurans]QBR90967.1 hypothetical protein EXE57_00795 [Nocardioides euryhalodurans]